MSKKFLEFDAGNFRFGKVRIKFGKILLNALMYFVVTLSLTVLAYALFALIFRTDVESRLRKEIRMYEDEYAELVEKQELLKDAIANLQHEDNEIYEEIFNSDSEDFGGSGVVNIGDMKTIGRSWNFLPDAIKLRVPPLGMSIIKCKRKSPKLLTTNHNRQRQAPL